MILKHLNVIYYFQNVKPSDQELNKMSSVRKGISCYTFGKRTVHFIKQRLNNRQYVIYVCCQGQLAKANQRPRPLPMQLDKPMLTNNCYGYKHFHPLNTTNSVHLLFHCNNGGFGKQISCHGQHHIQQLRSFSTAEKEKVMSNTDSASANEHWGPYLVSRIHSLEESSRFHGYSILRWGLSIVVAVLVAVYVFRDRLRDNVADEVADVASRSMGKSVHSM